MDPTKGMVLAIPSEPSKIVDGYVSFNRPAPASFSEPLWVIDPEYSTTVPIGPCAWGAEHGAALPAQGARVIFFDGPVPVILWWEGEELNTAAPSGAAGGALAGTYPNPTLAATPAWIAPELEHAWANVGGEFPDAGYLKDALGFVHLKGRVHSGSSGTTVFTLPPGYRLLKDDTFPAAAINGSTPVAALVSTGPTGAIGIYMAATITDVSLRIPPFLAEA